jgi:predicted methyltransferase
MSTLARAHRALPLLALPVLALPLLCLSLLGGIAGANPSGEDVYDASVAHPGRPARDLKRDPIEHPAEVLRLAGIKPGMQVADFMAADGYWSELASYIVGPQGHVLLINNPTWDYWSGNHWQERIKGRLPNVEHRTEDPERLSLPDNSVDALLLVKVFHDFYWVDADPNAHWPRFDVDRVVGEIARVVKPGGTLLLIDHSAKPGTGTKDSGKLHRIDEAYARQQFERHGFKVVATSDVLRRPDDRRDQITYQGPMVGKTDRFVIVFRKSAA